jgi:DNA-binding NarL/FixJ family response regulator
MPIRLAIVDSHTLTRYGLRELVSQHADIEIVGECGSAADGRDMVEMTRPDVVTMDVVLPDCDGLRLAREFRDRYAALGIVILTSQGEDYVLFRALETGVSAFVAKTAPVQEVLAAIRHAAVAASSFTASGLAAALASRRTVQDRLGLSPREAEVLRLLQDGLSIPAIALGLFISQSTVKTYVARLYDKLGAANRSQALMKAVRYGLINYQQDVPAQVSVTAPEWASGRRRSPRARQQRRLSVARPLPQPRGPGDAGKRDEQAASGTIRQLAERIAPRSSVG